MMCINIFKSQSKQYFFQVSHVVNQSWLQLVPASILGMIPPRVTNCLSQPSGGFQFHGGVAIIIHFIQLGW